MHRSHARQLQLPNQPTSSRQQQPHQALIKQPYWQSPNFPTALRSPYCAPPAPRDTTPLPTEGHISTLPQPSIKTDDKTQDFPSSYVLDYTATPTHLTHSRPTMLSMSGDSYTATGTTTMITHARPVTVHHDTTTSPPPLPRPHSHAVFQTFPLIYHHPSPQTQPKFHPATFPHIQTVFQGPRAYLCRLLPPPPPHQILETTTLQRGLYPVVLSFSG